MSRFYFFCIIFCSLSISIVAHADEVESATIPEPPELSKTIHKAKGSTTESTPIDEQSSVPPVAAPEPPDIPMSVKNGEKMEPDITIVRKGKKIIQEYRRGGAIYMVKVIPDKGPAYYLIDINGDGKLDVRASDLDKGLSINQWKLLEWN